MTPHDENENENEIGPSLSPVDIESDVDEEEQQEMTEDEVENWVNARWNRAKANPMKEPLKAPWDLSVSATDMKKIKTGFRSRSMDDKWDLLVEDPDDNGGVSLHILRNWHQEEAYVLHVVGEEGGEGDGTATIQGITWEGNKAGLQCDAEQAKKEAVIVCRLFLECGFETLPEYPSSVLWDSKAYKKLGAQ